MGVPCGKQHEKTKNECVFGDIRIPRASRFTVSDPELTLYIVSLLEFNVTREDRVLIMNVLPGKRRLLL